MSDESLRARELRPGQSIADDRSAQSAARGARGGHRAAAVPGGPDPFEAFDDYVGGDVRNPYPELARHRKSSPVMHGGLMGVPAPGFGPDETFTLLRFEDCSAALRDAGTFSSRIYDGTIGAVMGRTILGMDDPEHRKHRNLVAYAFRQSALERWNPSLVAPVCNSLVDQFAAAGVAELVRQYTSELPTRVIARLLGLPDDDVTELQRWSVELIGAGADEERGMAASAGLRDYFAEVVALKRRHLGKDVISDLVKGGVDGETLADEVIYSFLRLLLPAGVETTYRSTGNLLYLLLSTPKQLARVEAKRGLLASAVEEALRVEPPLLFITRMTTREVEVAGVRIPEGASVEICLGSANHDESRWFDPDDFDIQRPAKPHLAFATGAHMCLGLHLARMEMRVAATVLLDRLKGLRLDPREGNSGTMDPHIKGMVFRSPSSLPVAFEASG